MRGYAAIGLAVLLGSSAVPAFADWNHVGSVMFSTQVNHFSTRADFHSDRLALTSRVGDVYCRGVRATFGNGQTQTIFSGMLHANATVNVDLPGDSKSVHQMSFDCQPTDASHASVDVAANIVGQPVG